MRHTEMRIFTRAFDFIVWLLPMTNNFPRAHRHTMTRWLLDAAFDLRERLEEANLRREGVRRASLDRADEALAAGRLYLRLTARMGVAHGVRGWVNHTRFGSTVRPAQGGLAASRGVTS